MVRWYENEHVGVSTRMVMVDRREQRTGLRADSGSVVSISFLFLPILRRIQKIKKNTRICASLLLSVRRVWEPHGVWSIVVYSYASLFDLLFAQVAAVLLSTTS